MRLHHLDAGTMHPRGLRLLSEAGYFVDHVIVAETPAGDLALIDTGIGSLARRDPRRYLGRLIAATGRPDTDPRGSALAQIEALGRDASDVRDIFMTHLDSDHASGLSDFPQATVHVHHAELAAAQRPVLAERLRYCALDWAHGARFQTFGERVDSNWEGAPAVSGFAGLEDLVFAIPLPGHTRGHTGYALRADAGWLVHAGDSFYESSSISGTPNRRIETLERTFAVTPGQIAEIHRRLAAWAARGITVLCSHDPAQIPSRPQPTDQPGG